MPRLLDRLVEKITSRDLRQSALPRRPRPPPPHLASRLRPRPAAPNWSHLGRTRSILLDEINPVVHKKLYAFHKSLPPKLRVGPSRKPVEEQEYDRPRRMTDQERTWWSSPYLRMLASPLRQCISTTRYLPSDFMIRLAPFRMASLRLVRGALTTLLPDGLQHPKFMLRKAGRGYYVTCWKDVVEELGRGVAYKRIAPGISIHIMLCSQISHLLRIRVLQELEVLVDALRILPRGADDSPVIRRLTRAEFRELRESGVVGDAGAVAIFVVPPVNRDPQTKRRPESASSSDASPPTVEAEDSLSKTPLRPSPPLSMLHPIHDSVEPDAEVLPPYVRHAQARVPLYNGLTLFPLRSQRAALHALLSRVLDAERRARWRENARRAAGGLELTSSAPADKSDSRGNNTKGDQKASHAFLLRSNARTVMRADTVPLAIALWRIRMWEGQGWEEGTNSQHEGWLWRSVKRKPSRTLESTPAQNQE